MLGAVRNEVSAERLVFAAARKPRIIQRVQRFVSAVEPGVNSDATLIEKGEEPLNSLRRSHDADINDAARLRFRARWSILVDPCFWIHGRFPVGEKHSWLFDVEAVEDRRNVIKTLD